MVTQAPREPHTLDTRLPVSPDGRLKLLSGQVRDTIGKHTNAIIFGLGLMVASSSFVLAANNAQNVSPTSAETGSESEQIA